MSVEFTVLYNGVTYADFSQAMSDAVTDLQNSFNSAAPKVNIELKRFFNKIADEMSRRHGTPWKAGTTRNSLSLRSGGGVRSIRNSIKLMSGKSYNRTGGSISTGKMTIHETGGTITPKRSQYLTIPTDFALDSRGVPIKQSARQWENTFVRTSKAGNLLIFQKRGKDIVPLYVLKKSVRLRPRLGMAKTFEDNIPFFEQRVLNVIDKELG